MVRRKADNLIQEYSQDYIIGKLNNEYISNEKLIELKSVIHKLYGSKKFIHITTEIDNILDDRKLLCSSGGLGGVVYAVPVNDTIHNLGEYILNFELPMFLKNNNLDKKIGMILLEPQKIRFGIIDNLKFGEVYYSISQSEKFGISEEDLIKIECDEYAKITKAYKARQLGDELDECINSSKILRMAAFETLLECLFLRQIQYDNNEMNNKNVKDIIFQTSPEISKQFFSSNFAFKSNAFEKIRSLKEFDSYRIDEYFIYLLKDKCEKYFIDNPINLKGHILYRYFDYRETFENALSKIIWEEAEKKRISILTYILPKGEVGILPIALKSAKTVCYCNKKVVSKDTIDIVIERELAKKYVMRNPTQKVAR